MFICDPCLKKSFENEPSFGKSYGRCEFCEKPKVCNDIPSRHLINKKVKTKDEKNI